MSEPSNRESIGSSSSNNNNRVTPSFFGSPSLYQSAPQTIAEKGKNDMNVSSSPKGRNPYWNDTSNPPPPYSPAYNEPNLPHSSSISADPSAPPLDIEPSAPRNYSHNSNIYPQRQPYPPSNYQNYGSVPYPRQSDNTSDANILSWPWIAPPSATGLPILVDQPTQRPPHTNNNNKKKNCCEILIKYFFYFLCICLVIRLIDLLSGGVSFGDYCSQAVVWEPLPKELEYGSGLKVRVVGGHLSSGSIKIESLDDSMAKDGVITGTIKPTLMVSPPSLASNADLTFSVTHLWNGTVLEINIPQGLSFRSCISLNAVIYVPDATTFLVLEVQNSRFDVTDGRLNVKELALHTTNAAIEFHSAWQGENLELKSTNGLIDVNKRIQNSKSITLASTNGNIRTRGSIRATEFIDIRTTNAAIDTDDALEGHHIVSLASTNGHVNARNITALQSNVKTTNGRIQIDHSYVSEVFNVQTTNGKLRLILDEGYHTEVVAYTTNAEISAEFPLNFEGTFEASTSSHQKIKLVDTLNWSHLTSIGKGHAYGTRFPPGHDNDSTSPMGRISLTTSNSNIGLQYGHYAH